MNDQSIKAGEIVEALRAISAKNSISAYKRSVCKDAAALIEHQAAQLAAATAERDAAVYNEPLTLEELRGMDGEPVWCEDGTVDAGIVRMAEDWATERKEPHIWMFDKYGDVKCYNIRLMLEQGAKFYRRPPEGGEGK